MWGIIPAAGIGSRIQPLAFSKELLPVGSRPDGAAERPRAVSEYLVERMLRAGANKVCFVISPGKSDILGYFGHCYAGANIVYAVQPQPAGLCDAVFRAHPLIHGTGLHPSHRQGPPCRSVDLSPMSSVYSVTHVAGLDHAIALPQGGGEPTELVALLCIRPYRSAI